MKIGNAVRGALVVGLTLVAGSSFAVVTDPSSLAAAVDFSNVNPALYAVGGALILPRIAKFAIRTVLSMF